MNCTVDSYIPSSQTVEKLQYLSVRGTLKADVWLKILEANTALVFKKGKKKKSIVCTA